MPGAGLRAAAGRARAGVRRRRTPRPGRALASSGSARWCTATGVMPGCSAQSARDRAAALRHAGGAGLRAARRGWPVHRSPSSAARRSCSSPGPRGEGAAATCPCGRRSTRSWGPRLRGDRGGDGQSRKVIRCRGSRRPRPTYPDADRSRASARRALRHRQRAAGGVDRRDRSHRAARGAAGRGVPLSQEAVSAMRRLTLMLRRCWSWRW